jgi:tetratricopeptide (TPR) repeat protein
MKKFIGTFMAFLLGLPMIANAGLREDGADFLVKIGVEYQKSGNAEDAIHEYSKALLIDPNNQGARKHLAEYGLKDGLYKPVKLKNSERISLGDQVNGFTQKISVLEVDKLVMDTTFDKLKQKNTQLLNENQEKDLKIKELQDKIGNIDQAFKSNSAVSDMAKNLKQEDKVAVQAIDSPSPMINQVVAEMGHSVIEPEYAKVNKTLELSPLYVSPQNKHIMQTQGQDHLAQVVTALEDDLRLAQKEMINKDLALAKMQQETLHFVDEAIDANSKLVDTKEKYISHLDQVGVSKAPNSDMKKQLAEAQDRVSEQDKILNDQYGQMKALEGDLNEANGQVERLLNLKKK